MCYNIITKRSTVHGQLNCLSGFSQSFGIKKHRNSGMYGGVSLFLCKKFLYFLGLKMLKQNVTTQIMKFANKNKSE